MVQGLSHVTQLCLRRVSSFPLSNYFSFFGHKYFTVVDNLPSFQVEKDHTSADDDLYQ